MIYGLQGVGLILMTALLFYDSLWACIPGCPFLWFFYRWKQRELIAKRNQLLRSQFREGIRSLSTALQAGFSVENALREATEDLRMMEWKENMMVREFEEMQHKIAASQTIEQVFRDFALRSGLEDANVFADIFAASKRSSQNLTCVIGNTVRIIGEKMEVEQEIHTILSARTYEQKIMSLMPFGILFYLRVTSGAFLEILYEGMPGRLIMTGCLSVYLAVWRLGKKLVQIEV